MPVILKEVKVKMPIQNVKKVANFAMDHGMAPKVATTIKYILGKVFKLHELEDVQAILRREGGTTISFIETAVHEALIRRGYPVPERKE